MLAPFHLMRKEHNLFTPPILLINLEVTRYMQPLKMNFMADLINVMHPVKKGLTHVHFQGVSTGRIFKSDIFLH